jgi:hypothetical protein
MAEVMVPTFPVADGEAAVTVDGVHRFALAVPARTNDRDVERPEASCYGVFQATARSPGGAAMTPLCQAKRSSGVASMALRSVAGRWRWTS